jgi:NitT/TauT family transport system permease protein
VADIAHVDRRADLVDLENPVRPRGLSADSSTSDALPGLPRRRRWPVYAGRLALVLLWLGSWEIAATYWIDPFFYSKPSLIFAKIFDWFAHGTSYGSIWLQMAYTLQEAVYGFALGSIVGVILGVVLGRSRFLSEVLAPFIKAANAIPRIVLASLFVIWFGFGMSSKVATAFVLVFFGVFFNAFQGAREVPKVVDANARILGASRLQMMLTVVLPSATSWILASLHTAFGFALIGAIVGEYTGADKGLGMLIAHSQGTFDSAGIYAAMIITTVLALLAEAVLTIVERRLTRWQPR